MAGRIDRKVAEQLLLEYLLRAPLGESTRPQDIDDLYQIESMLGDEIVPESFEIGLDDEC